jgi:putative transcription factor
MASCDMCGSESEIFLALIEGVELNVCKKCASFGKIIKRPVPVKKKVVRKSKQPEREIIQVIREDFSKIIRDKREKLGLKQKEFAKYLAEKESLIHKVEAGTYTPSLSTARKMERYLNITLVVQKQIEPQSIKKKTSSFTIGDIIKVK